MRFLRATLLAIGLMSFAACGGGQKNANEASKGDACGDVCKGGDLCGDACKGGDVCGGDVCEGGDVCGGDLCGG